MYVRMYKDLIENKICNSHKMFFPIIVYIMMVNNINNISYFSVGNILDYFSIQRTTRNFKLAISCLRTMSEEQLVRQTYGDHADEISINSLVGFEVLSDNTLFNQIQDFEIESIIDIFKSVESSYLFANIFLIIKRSTYVEINNDSGLEMERATISYNKIMSSINITSNTTLSKYIKTLESNGLFKVMRETERSEEVNDDSGKKEYKFKTTNTYYFKERR